MNNNSTQALAPKKIDRYKTFRTLAVIGFIVYPLIYLCLHHYANLHPMAIRLLNMAIGMYFILNWFYLDAEINRYAGKRHAVAVWILLFAVVTVPYYLIQSRAAGKRLKSIMIMLSVFLLNGVVTVLAMKP